jgi:cation-transporting ATPase 13A1
MLDEYWQYTIFTLFSIVALEATTCFQRMKTFSTLGGMANKPTPLLVYRDQKWTMMTTEDLLPGDLVSLVRQRQAAPTPAPGAPAAAAAAAAGGGGGGEGGARGKRAKATDAALAAPAAAAPRKPMVTVEVVPCDMVLLSGSAVVNESSLTGESVPQMKDALKVPSSCHPLPASCHQLALGSAPVQMMPLPRLSIGRLRLCLQNRQNTLKKLIVWVCVCLFL